MNTDAQRAYREADLRAALATDPRVGEPELDVSLTGEAVIVRGVVPTEDRRTLVRAVIAELAPELQFVDAMEVATAFPRPEGDEVVG